MTIRSSGKDRRCATDAEKSLATALIGGAFALIVAVMWGGIGLFDKLDDHGRVILISLGTTGCLLLIGSIIAGGRGIAYGTKVGAWGSFDWQAKLGCLGMLVLLAAPPVVGFFTWKGSNQDLANEVKDFRKELGAMRNRLDITDHRLDTTEREVTASKHEVIVLHRELDTVKNQIHSIDQSGKTRRYDKGDGEYP